jgi:signal transduction histidine kinase/ActR/RegA family two-component response regulator
MHRLPYSTRLSFQAKVLIPAVSVMVLLVAVTMWVVNRRISRQLKREAAQSLVTAEAVFKNTLGIRTKNLLLRFRNLPNEPRYLAALQTAEPKTIQHFLEELLGGELDGELLQYKTADGRLIANAHASLALDLVEFEQRSRPSVAKAMEGEGNVDTLRVSRRLFDVVSVPVTFNRQLLGVLTFGTEIGQPEAADLSQTTRCGVVLLAEKNVAAASLQQDDLFQQCVALFGSVSKFTGKASSEEGRPVEQIALPEHHFLGLVGTFSSLSGDPGLGYVLLYPQEPALRELQATRRTIVWVSFVGILLSTGIIWWLVRRVTQPLRQLRDSAEAVGRGDFSRRVEVNTGDECGELAGVFNQMTTNLKSSREQLERTVETLTNTQAQLVQSEKLRAIGTLAGGIAHDFNNILGAILGFGELVLEDVPGDSRAARNMRQVIKAGLRAKDLVRQILAFSRQSEPQRVNVKLSSLMEETLKLLRATIPATINIQSRINTTADTVVADATQLHQVLMNLGTNASHAMREKGGTLTMALSDFAAPNAGSPEVPKLKPGAYLRLDVTDTGHGMEPAVVERIFEPFFTTKPVGEGTGLGLSVVHGIIEHHGGEIKVASQPGRGTTFSIFLPRSVVNEIDAAAAVDQPLHGNRERILVVDDEEPLVNMMQQKLTRLGYEVVAHHDSVKALEAFQAAPRSFDVVITDHTMPRLTGADLAREMVQLRPDTPVILCSGSGQALIAADRLRPAIRECVLKPVNFAELTRCIRRMLDRKATLESKQP